MSKYSGVKSTSLLKDSSWIKKLDDEDEDIDRDPNFAKTVLNRTSETTVGPDGEEVKTTTITTSRSSSVQALTQRFTSQEDVRTSTLPSRTSYTKSSYSTVKSDSPTSTRTTSVSKDGKTTETTVTTTQSLRSPLKSPTKTDAFSERVLSSSRGQTYTSYTPTKTTRVTETSVVDGNATAEDKLYDTLIPSGIKDDSPTDSTRTISMTETVTVKSSNDSNDAEDALYSTLSPSSTRDDYSPTDRSTIKTSTTTRTSSTAEDDLYGTLLPRSITSLSDPSSPISSSSSSYTKREIITVESSRGGDSPTLSSPTSTRRTSYNSYTEDLPSSTRTTSYTLSSTPSYEYNSISSPSYTTKTYRSSSRSDDSLSDPVYSSSSKSVYSSERTVLEKDLCTLCRKPFVGDAKMVLDEMNINCHASCFKCEVCNSTLGHMKAGDSMWIYKRMVHCENCFEVTREKWRR